MFGDSNIEQRSRRINHSNIFHSDALFWIIDSGDIGNFASIVYPEYYYKSEKNIPKMLIDHLHKRYGSSNSELIKTPVAIILSKFDLLRKILPQQSSFLFDDRKVLTNNGFNNEQYRRIYKEIASILNSNEPSLLAHMSQHFLNYGLFAVSALGHTPRDMNIEDIHSLAVEEPMLWLLDHFGMLDI